MEEIPIKSKIEIQPVGSYLDVDQDGFVINPAGVEKIQPEWKPVVDDVVALYEQTYGKDLKNVYIRGSVAKGGAVENVSDIDAFGYVDLPKDEIKRDTIAQRRELKQKYDFVSGIEMAVRPMSRIERDTIILNQAVCVYGEPIPVPRMKVGRETAIHSPNFHNRFKWFEEFLKKDESEEKTKKSCVSLMKELLRVGFEITMDRSQKYTRDLYPCYETFAEYYPEKEVEMREVLDLALNSTADKNKMKEIMEGIGTFLLAEVPKHCEVKEK